MLHVGHSLIPPTLSRYGFVSRLGTRNAFDRPSCRYDYSDRNGLTFMRGCATDPNGESVNGVLLVESTVVGWTMSPRGFSRCYAGSGQQPSGSQLQGSFKCPGLPDGSEWARVWFR